jgi:hypothetical protein
MQLGIRGYRVLAAVLAIVLAALLLKLVVLGSTAPGHDARTAVQLTAGERAFVLAEMRGFVAGLAQMDVALSGGRRDEAAQASRALGTTAAHDAPAALLGKLPLGFKRLAFDTHRGFDALADDIAQGAPLDRILARRGTVLGQCVECHAAYSFDIAGAREPRVDAAHP